MAFAAASRRFTGKGWGVRARVTPIVALVAAALGVGVAAPPSSQATAPATTLTSGWTFTDLGSLPGDNFSVANGINDRGYIVGRSGNHAVAFTSGGVVRLDDLAQSDARAVNNAGRVVGVRDDPNSGTAVEFAGGSTVDLGSGRAEAINSSGVVVGYGTVQTTRFEQHALQFLPVMSDLHPEGAHGSTSVAVNDAGAIVGNVVDSATFDSTAVRFQGGGATPLASDQGDRETRVQGINSLGTSVGTVNPRGSNLEYGAIIENDSLKDLGPFPGLGADQPWKLLAINDRGTAVGRAGEKQTVAVLRLNGALINVDSWRPAGVNWRLETLNSVNRLNQAVGYARNCVDFGPNNCVLHAFLLNPPGLTAPVLGTTTTIPGSTTTSSSTSTTVSPTTTSTTTLPAVPNVCTMLRQLSALPMFGSAFRPLLVQYGCSS